MYFFNRICEMHKVYKDILRSVNRLKYIHTIKFEIKIKNGEIKYNAFRQVYYRVYIFSDS